MSFRKFGRFGGMVVKPAGWTFVDVSVRENGAGCFKVRNTIKLSPSDENNNRLIPSPKTTIKLSDTLVTIRDYHQAAPDSQPPNSQRTSTSNNQLQAPFAVPNTPPVQLPTSSRPSTTPQPHATSPLSTQHRTKSPNESWKPAESCQIPK